MKISAIIPTYQRPTELERCITSILRQTRLPDELIIVDDGSLEKVPLLEDIQRLGISCIYKRKEQKGLIASRNLGAKIASGDIIFLLEDDIVLFPDFIEQIMNVYECCKYEDLGGVGGVIISHQKYSQREFLLKLAYMLFLIISKNPARVLASGFDTADFETVRFKGNKWVKVDFLAGGVSSFKKEVFHHFLFSEKYQDSSGYALGEDREFGYRVSRKYRLLVNPRAKVYHLKAQKSGYGDQRKKGRTYVISRYIFFTDHLANKRWRWPLFYYSLAGLLFLRCVVAILSMNKGEARRVKGILEGVMAILKARGQVTLT